MITRNAITVVWAYGSCILLWCQWSLELSAQFLCDTSSLPLITTRYTQIARLMGPTWGPPGSFRPSWAPYWPHQPCYQGRWSLAASGWTRSSVFEEWFVACTASSHYMNLLYIYSLIGNCTACISLEVASSIPAGSAIIYTVPSWFYVFPCARESQKVCKSPELGRSSKLSDTAVETHTCIPDVLWVVQCHVIGIVFFLHNSCGMKRTCWTTGSSRCSLSLEPGFGGAEFDPNLVHDNSSVLL